MHPLPQSFQLVHLSTPCFSPGNPQPLFLSGPLFFDRLAVPPSTPSTCLFLPLLFLEQRTMTPLSSKRSLFFLFLRNEEVVALPFLFGIPCVRPFFSQRPAPVSLSGLSSHLNGYARNSLPRNRTLLSALLLVRAILLTQRRDFLPANSFLFHLFSLPVFDDSLSMRPLAIFLRHLAISGDFSQLYPAHAYAASFLRFFFCDE